MAQKSAELKKKYFFIPEDNLDQAAVISNIGILSCRDLDICHRCYFRQWPDF